MWETYVLWRASERGGGWEGWGVHGIEQTWSSFVIGDDHMQFVQIVIEKEKWFSHLCAVCCVCGFYFIFYCQVGLLYARIFAVLSFSLSPAILGGYKNNFACTSSDDKTGGFLRSIRSKIVNLQMKYRPSYCCLCVMWWLCRWTIRQISTYRI